MGMEFTQGRTNSLSTLYNLEEEPPKNYSSAPGLTTTDAIFVEKEHMFDKVVTPSDVGKLNRLVIPKQHAEKHFPLDTAANEKGLQLSFEDSTGKSWRFRYSYWNSSQSYVMTKGWSRFVKEKRLGAGDTVSFCRGVGAAGRGRLFIDWRRRPDPAPLQQYQESMLNHRQPFIPWATTAGARVLIPPYECASSSRYQHQYQNYQNHQQHQQIVFYRPHQVAMRPMVLESVPIRNNQVAPGAAKRVRLFGVNLDCPPPGYSGESSTGNNHGISMINRISSTHGHGYGYLPVPVQNEALPVLQLPTAADTESSLSEKEDCSLDLDL